MIGLGNVNTDTTDTPSLISASKVQVLAGQHLNIGAAENTAFVEDTFKSWSLVGNNIGYALNHKVRDETSTSSTTLTGAHLAGNSVDLVAGGNAHLVATTLLGQTGVTVTAGGSVVIESGQETFSTHHEHQESGHGVRVIKTDGRVHVVAPNENFEKLKDNGSTVTPVASVLDSAQGAVTVSGGLDVALLGTKINAATDVSLTAGQRLLLGGAVASVSHEDENEKGTVIGRMRDGESLDRRTGTVVPGSIDAGGKVNLTAGTGVELGAVDLRSGGAVVFDSPSVSFLAERNSDYSSHKVWDKDRGYEVNKGDGHVDERLTLATIDAKGGITLPETTKVSVQLDGHGLDAAGNAIASAAGNGQLTAVKPEQFRDLAHRLSLQPGMAYLADLAKRSDIDWQAFATTHQQWDYKSQGLTQTGAAVLTVVVAIFTYGAGSAYVGAATGSAVTGVTATVINAGYTSLMTSAAISFANNGGDLGKTLHDLGSSQTIRSMVTSMITAGILDTQFLPGADGTTVSLNDMAGLRTIPGLGSVGTFNWDNLGRTALGIAGRGIVSAGVGTAINGGSFEDSFRQSLVSDLAAIGANAIGTTWGGGKDPLMQTAAHGLLGCAVGAAKGGDCAAGALGGAAESVLGNIVDKFGGLSPDGSGPSRGARAIYTGGAIVLADILADATGLDSATAIDAARNSATNNYLSHPENKDRSDAARQCAEGDAAACARYDALQVLDKQRDTNFHGACDGQSSSGACYQATVDMRDYLATFAAPPVRTAIEGGLVGTDELGAHRNELQSYIPLIATGDRTVFNNTTASERPDRYNADPYQVIDPKQNGLYVPVKINDQWLTVGTTDRVFTEYGALNGMKNPPDYAPGLMGVHMEKINPQIGVYTLYYTPTYGFFTDIFKAGLDKMGFTTDDARNFSSVLTAVQAGDLTVTWVAHSRGGSTFAEGARIAEGNLSNNRVFFDSGANNRWVTGGILADRQIDFGANTDTRTNKPYLDSPFDLVPNIVGLNGNPFEMMASLFATPLLFIGPEWSPHTLPYEPRPRSPQSASPSSDVKP